MAQQNNQILTVGLWLLSGIGTFSFGLRLWYDFVQKNTLYIAIAFLACVLDLVVSMSAYQINALITGLMLIALFEYRNGHFFSAGIILLLAANLKVYPVVFLIALALKFDYRYWVGLLSAGIVAFLLPAMFVGWSHNLDMHIAWFNVVFNDSVGNGILDVSSAFQRAGMGSIGYILRILIFIVSIPLFFTYLYFSKSSDWQPWISFGLASMILLSPRTEVYTYVMLAPAYILMTSWCAESEKKFIQNYGGLLFMGLSVLIASSRFVNPSWYVSESSYEIFRVLGAIGFWLLTASILIAVFLEMDCKSSQR